MGLFAHVIDSGMLSKSSFIMEDVDVRMPTSWLRNGSEKYPLFHSPAHQPVPMEVDPLDIVRDGNTIDEPTIWLECHNLNSLWKTQGTMRTQ